MTALIELTGITKIYKMGVERVHALEDRRVLRADRRQLVDVEEAPVVDLFAGDAPVRQPVGLDGEQVVERVEAVRLAFDAVEGGDDGQQVQVRNIFGGQKLGQAAIRRGQVPGQRLHGGLGGQGSF